MTYIKKLVMHGFKSFPRKTEIPFTPGINIFLGPNGSGKCLTGESLIQLADGSLTRIDKIVNSNLDNAVKTEDGWIAVGNGEKILSLNFDNLKVEEMPVKAFIKKTSPKKILSIKTRSGRKIKSTKYHPFFILKNGKVIPARADELKPGIKIATPRKINFEPKSKYFSELLNKITLSDNIYIPYKENWTLLLKANKGKLTWKQFAEKLGVPYYTIKGVLDKQAIHFSHLIKILRELSFSDEEICNLIIEVRANGKNTKFYFKSSPEFARFFGYLLAEGRLAKSSQIWFTNGDKEVVEDYVALVKKLFNKNPLVREYKPNCWDVIIFSEPLKKILRALGMASNTGEKSISNIILRHSSNEEISQLLNGLYCGDGYISKSSIEITTKSKKLARGMETCLLRLGMIPRTRTAKKTIKSSGFEGLYEHISLYGVENFMNFNKNISLVHNKKRKLISDNLEKKSNPNLDLIGVSDLVKDIVQSSKINIKKTRKEFPRLDSYYYNQSTPSRQGLKVLMKELFIPLSQDLESLKTMKNLINSDIFWDELTEVKEVDGEEWVYDLTVEGHHNFIANNIFAHNSNISDAICFVLGRMSMKSLRAARAGNLIFLGSKAAAPAKEAFVEIVFDNSQKIFSPDSNEITVKRILRRNGQSVYKINNETKKRQEILFLLAQAGIDPQGFNIILQGEIQNFVRMQAEERRMVLEEVSGISVYESRKEKSLHELEKTEEKLKEINSILRERTAYLNNLEKERQQALRYKKLEAEIRKLKASIINLNLQKKKKEAETINSDIEGKNKELEKIKKTILGLETEIKNTELKISAINKEIQESTGLEQEKLNSEISNLRAELAVLHVKKENQSSKISEFLRQKKNLQETLKELEETIKQLKKEGWVPENKIREVEKKKLELEKLDGLRKKFYMMKSELKSIKERLQDKNALFQNYANESDFLLKQIEKISITLFDKRSSQDKLDRLRHHLAEKRDSLSTILKRGAELEKTSYANESEIENQKKMLEKISKMDICPVCKSKITHEHMEIIKKEMLPRMESLKKQIGDSDRKLKEIYEKKELLSRDIEQISGEISKTEADMAKLSSIEEKKEQIKSLQKKTDEIKEEISGLMRRGKKLEEEIDSNSNIEEKYETLNIEVQEISIRTRETLDSEVSFKERETERIRIAIKQILRNKEDLAEEISSLAKAIEEKEKILEKKKIQEEHLNRKFRELISEREDAQKKTRDLETEISKKQHEIRGIEQVINDLKIEKARTDAEAENLETELSEFGETEMIKGNRDFLYERLVKVQEIFSNIGPVNLRSLEVYDSIKKEYDLVKEKAEIIIKEKEGILKIIQEIDIKKKKVFMQTLKQLNELFSRNFSQLSNKGHVYLELENPAEPFEPGSGVQITVKTGHGRYFDVKSLSGGEQTLVALSLIFAIQEYRPYYFYLLDEIDAALDKKNSERLAGLLNKYMQKGQYIIITHNDEVISRATNLYGVSMHDGISKIISLKV